VPLVSPGPRACATFLISAADLLNDRVFPVCDSHEVTLLRVLTGRGGECSGNPERHEYELYLAIEDSIAQAPDQEFCERFHKTVLNEFYRVAFRKKVYRSIDELQVDSDLWIREYNEQRPRRQAPMESCFRPASKR
jgi:hypothetical protein